MAKVIVEGKTYYRNQDGNLISEEQIKPQDLVRDSLVQSLVTQYLLCRDHVKRVKAQMEKEINQYINTIMIQYDLADDDASHKNSMTLTSFDGRFKVVMANNSRISLDENVMAAKVLLDEYLDEQLAGSSDALKTLVADAFRMRQGQVDLKSVLRLTRLNIPDEKFCKAVNIIKESIVTTRISSSLRVYVRDDAGKYIYKPMDFATLSSLPEGGAGDKDIEDDAEEEEI